MDLTPAGVSRHGDPTSPSPSTGSRPWAIAHRGASQLFTENTLAAVTAAVRYGVDAVKVDVRVTGDGVPVLHHDATLERVWGDPAVLADLTMAQLRRTAPEIPTLAEALAAVARSNVALLLDVGSLAAARAAVQEVEAADGAWHVTPELSGVWFCGDPQALAWLSAEGVRAPRLLSWDRWTPVPEATVAAVAPAFFNPWHRLVSPALIRDWHRRGVQVCTGTVDSAVTRRRLMRWGVDAVISNAVEGMVADAHREGRLFVLPHADRIGRRPGRVRSSARPPDDGER